MNATLRLRKSYILKGAVFTTTFFVVVCVHFALPLVLNLPEGERVAIMVLAWGPCMVVYGGMLLMSIYILSAAFRAKVIIQGKHVTDVGVFRQRKFDLTQVTLAQWYKWRPRLRVSTPVGWVSFDLRVHRTEEARMLIQYFRNGLPPEIQEGWTPEWKEKSVAFDSISNSQGRYPWSRIAVFGVIAGIGAGVICGLIVQYLTLGLEIKPYSWSGSPVVDWTMYGFSAGLSISIPVLCLLAAERLCAWLDR